MDTPASTYDSRKDTLEHIAKVNVNIKKLTNVIFKRLSEDKTHKTIMSPIAYRLNLRGNEHDSSKLSSIEKELFDKYTPLLAGLTYGSKEFDDCKAGMGPALDNHYAENRHHPEHFENGMSDMNLVDLMEMFCDWAASTERHNDGDIHKSIEINKKRFGYCDVIASIFHNTAKAYSMGNKHLSTPEYTVRPAKFEYNRFESGISGMALTTILEQYAQWVTKGLASSDNTNEVVTSFCKEASCGKLLTIIMTNTII